MLLDILEPILVAGLTAVLSYIGIRLRIIFEEYVNTKTKQEIVQNTVQYVEQVFTTLDGAGKFQEAKKVAVDWLNDKGITISDAELTILIESSVKAIKGGFYSQIPVSQPEVEVNENVAIEIGANENLDI